MSAPPLIFDMPLGRAVRSALGDEPAHVLVVGSTRLAATLSKAGHAVTARREIEEGDPEKEAAGSSFFDTLGAELERYDAVVLMQVLGRRSDPGQDLARLVRAARPRALVILVEQAAWGRGGLWLVRMVGRVLGRSLITDATELSALCLNAGLTDLRQTWPQGLRSLVLTTGRVHALARTFG
jgi:hypothetical protein